MARRRQGTSGSSALGTQDYRRLASFRYALRRYLHFSEAETARVGLTGQQYQAMLAVRSHAGGAPATIAEFAREMLIRHNSAVGLVDRLVAQGMLARRRLAEDRRKVGLQLTPAGERVLRDLAAVHRRKLRRIGPGIHRLLGELAGAWRRPR